MWRHAGHGEAVTVMFNELTNDHYITARTRGHVTRVQRLTCPKGSLGRPFSKVIDCYVSINDNIHRNHNNY